MFDIEDIINATPNFFSAFTKPEPCLPPPVCSRVAPNSQPFFFPTDRRLTHLDPYYYRKLNFSLLSLECLEFLICSKRMPICGIKTGARDTLKHPELAKTILVNHPFV